MVLLMLLLMLLLPPLLLPLLLPLPCVACVPFEAQVGVLGVERALVEEAEAGEAAPLEADKARLGFMICSTLHSFPASLPLSQFLHTQFVVHGKAAA